MTIHNIDINNPSWTSIEELLPIYAQMQVCPQDPIHHAEGDVWTHTKMCVNSLTQDTKWRIMSEEDKFITFYAMLLHDIGKPLTTKNDNGVITAKGHSAVGAVDARIWLWQQGVDFSIREKICTIIEFHQIPFFILNKEDFALQARKISWLGVWDNLIMCAKHDMLGRVCVDQQKHIDNIEFLNIYLEEQNLKNAHYVDDYTRMRYLASPNTVSPEYPLHREKKFEVLLMSGLPGSGKNTFIEQHYPHLKSISFDEERENLNISPSANGSAAVHKAYDKMKELLRAQKSFVFNATNLSKNLRQKPLDLFHNYGASVRIIYLEKSYSQLIRDDAARGDKSVGAKVINSMLFKWEPPSILEAENIQYEIIKNENKYNRKI